MSSPANCGPGGCSLVLPFIIFGPDRGATLTYALLEARETVPHGFGLRRAGFRRWGHGLSGLSGLGRLSRPGRRAHRSWDPIAARDPFRQTGVGLPAGGRSADRLRGPPPLVAGRRPLPRRGAFSSVHRSCLTPLEPFRLHCLEDRRTSVVLVRRPTVTAEGRYRRLWLRLGLRPGQRLLRWLARRQAQPC